MRSARGFLRSRVPPPRRSELLAGTQPCRERAGESAAQPAVLRALLPKARVHGVGMGRLLRVGECEEVAQQRLQAPGEGDHELLGLHGPCALQASPGRPVLGSVLDHLPREGPAVRAQSVPLRAQQLSQGGHGLLELGSGRGAVVVDGEGQRWRVRSPRTPEAGIRLETELQVLAGLTPAVRAGLPFRTPSVAGAVRLEGLRTFVYQDMPGRPVTLDELARLGEPAVQDVGRVLAAIHTLPSDVVDHADLPSYTAEQIRQRHLHALDQAATSGRVPPLLLRRWEEAMEEEALWRFTPVPVHGDLHEDNLLLERGRVVGVTGWTDLHVGDPAGLGITDLSAPDFGDAVEVPQGHLPVFWACGVTPQAAIMESRPPLAITHAPGHMLITDLPDRMFQVP